MAAAAGAGFSTATDLADWLVRALGMPFREAHHVAGQAVKRAEALGLDLAALPLAELQAIEPRDQQYVALSSASTRTYCLLFAAIFSLPVRAPVVNRTSRGIIWKK